MFKTELHLHTPAVSPCCDIPAEEIAERYLAAGYHTVVVTDHFTPAVTRREGAWSDTVEWFLSGYQRLKELLAGRIHVLFGFELRFDGYANDYLVYGLDAAFLRGARELPSLSRRAGCELIHEAGGMIFAAHPFRTNMTISNTKLLDGVEVFNGTPHTDSRNQFANEWAKCFGLLRTSGSDFHGGCFLTVNGKRTWHPYSDDEYGNHYTISGGILTDEPIRDTEQLKSILRGGDYSLICEGPAAEKSGMKTMPAKY